MNDLLFTDRCIAIVVNPRSGKGRAVKTGQLLVDQLKNREIPFTLYTNDWPENFDDFNEVWIVGGDGTVNYFINRYRDIKIPLVIFKGGTGNDFAWNLYGDITMQEQLELVLTASAKPVDAAICNGQLYVNSLGIGFDGEVLHSMGSIRKLGGHLGYLLIVLRKIFSFREFHFTIKLGERTWSERFLLVIVNNSSRTGGGFMVAPWASVTDGKLDMVLCRPLSVLKRLRYLPVIEKGKHLDLPFIVHTNPEACHIEAEQELYAQLDGEMIRSKIFDINILPGKILVRY